MSDLRFILDMNSAMETYGVYDDERKTSLVREISMLIKDVNASNNGRAQMDEILSRVRGVFTSCGVTEERIQNDLLKAFYAIANRNTDYINEAKTSAERDIFDPERSALGHLVFAGAVVIVAIVVIAVVIAVAV